MGKHSTPCKYVQVHHWCRLCNSPGEARSWGTAGCREAESGRGRTRSPASSCRWRGPYGRMGLGEEPARWLEKRPPAEPRQSPACEGWPWGVGVTQRCPGGLREGFAAGQKSVSSRLSTTAGRSLLRYPGQLQRRLLSRPVPSCPAAGGAWPRRRGGEHRHPGLFKERGSRARESQSSRAGSPSG